MDWSTYFPRYFSNDDDDDDDNEDDDDDNDDERNRDTNQKRVEFADIGCGYGGLLGGFCLCFNIDLIKLKTRGKKKNENNVFV